MRQQILLFLLASIVGTALSQCQHGLTVLNSTNHILLPINSCRQAVDTKDMIHEPYLRYNKANASETYLLMLLEALPNNNDMFVLHWLVSGIKSHGDSLSTKLGARVVVGYIPPTNKTDYEFRLYNMTGKDIWDQIIEPERNFFLPTQWLSKHQIYSLPLARTVFNGNNSTHKPVGWVVPPHPVGVQPPLPPYPPQHPPVQYPAQQLPQQPLPAQYPAQQPPVPSIPHQQPPSHLQPLPVYPSQPHPSQTFPQPQNPPQLNYHPIQKQYNINGTIFRILNKEDRSYNVLTINSTYYSSDSYNKHFKLTPYLIIDNHSYISRSLTHNPGKGPSLYLNNTLYVPYNPSKEIHHYHYHKGSASNVSPTVLTLTPIIALVLYAFHS